MGERPFLHACTCVLCYLRSFSSDHAPQAADLIIALLRVSIRQASLLRSEKRVVVICTSEWTAKLPHMDLAFPHQTFRSRSLATLSSRARTNVRYLEPSSESTLTFTMPSVSLLLRGMPAAAGEYKTSSKFPCPKPRPFPPRASDEGFPRCD